MGKIALLLCITWLYSGHRLVDSFHRETSSHKESSPMHHNSSSFMNDVLLAAHNLPPSEIQALQSLYNATDGANWNWKILGAHWVFSSSANPCTPPWQGVTCTSTISGGYLHVTGITLSSYGLSGTLPAAISSLTKLEILNLNSNNIYGILPESLGDLAALNTLNLQSNAINGSIPATFGNMFGLQFIYLDDNVITGSVPSELGTLPLLSVLQAPDNRLAGTLPNALCNAQSLVTVMLNINHIRGTLPDCFSQLASLRGIYLNDNRLTGTIPQWLGVGNSPPIQYFYVHNNFMTGTLPEALSNLTSVLELEIYGNFFNGTIPASYGNLSQMYFFFAGYNELTGTIPDIFTGTRSLKVLNLEYNFLTGSIPPSIGTCSHLYNINLDYNFLEGAIPNTLNNLTIIQDVLLRRNHLTGTLPGIFCNKSQLYYFQLDFNRLTGTIPDCLGNTTSTSILAEFSLGDNYLSGTIPASLALLKRLSQLQLNNNALSGSIPNTLGANTVRLKQLILNNNRLTGTIPGQLGRTATIQQLNLAFNHLHGPVPQQLSPALSALILNDNDLTGTVPAAIGNLTSLKSLLLNNNKLTGTLENAFNANAQRRLQSVILDNNQLTGTLPGTIFSLPDLNTFVASTNCFHGTLPVEICHAPFLTGLVLNGLSSASSCRHRLLPAITASYTIIRSVHGTIPDCMFGTSHLRTLQLSGNMLSGSLSPTAVISPQLSVLSLSHNALTGSIPAAFQLRSWNSLDLSYNKISGTLIGGMFTTTNTSTSTGFNATLLHLENNRLSGHIPSSIRHLVNISILGTNVFTCRIDNSDLPTHDSGRDHYQCGSREFDAPYYLWLGLVCAAVAVVLAVVLGAYRISLIDSFAVWYAEVTSRVDCGTVHLRNVSLSLDLLCRASVYATVFAVLVLLPLYVALSAYSGTTTHQYAWAVSAAYLAGRSAVIAEIILWFTLLGLVLWVYNRYAVKLIPKKFSMTTSAFSKEAMICSAYLLVNTVIVVAANVAYVYVVIYESSKLLVFVQIALAFFKFAWSNVAIDFILPAIVGRLRPVTTGEHAQFAATKYTLLALTASILNSVVIPCLVVAVVSPNCFYNVFAPPDDVKAAYVYYTCGDYLERQCLYFYTPAVGTSKYSPPFEYNFQCSTSLITYYSPAYVNLCIVSTFLSPVAQFIAQRVHQSAKMNTVWFKFLNTFLPPIWKPLPADAGRKTYFKPNKLFVNLITYLALILTFGVMFPPLAAALAVSVLVGAYFAKLKVGRFLTLAVEAQRLPEFLAVIERESEVVNAPAVLQRSLWVVVILSCWFYTIFLFDTLGDAVGFQEAYWVLIAIPLLPVCLYGVKEGYAALLPGKAKQDRTASVVGVEMEQKIAFSGTDLSAQFLTATAEGEDKVSMGDSEEVANNVEIVNIMHSDQV